MRFDRSILSLTLLLVSLAWTLWFVFAGFGNHQDPLYWLYKYQHLEGGWMAVGALLTGGAVVWLFGAELLPLRLFGWLCTVAAIALPYCCLLDSEQRKKNLHWLALTFLLTGYGAFQEFSPGTLTVLILSAIWVTASKSEIRNQKSEIITAILAGLAVSVRFPNILMLLVLIPLWKKRSLWCVPVAAATAGIVYLLGYLFITPAPLDASMTSHDLWPMITKLWTHAGKLIGFLLLGIGVMGASSLTLPLKGEGKQIAAGLITGLALVLYIAYVIPSAQWYNIDLTYLLSALCLVIALTTNPLTSNPLTTNPLTTNPLTYGAVILMIATLGTDTAWLKLFPAVLCLLPVAAAQHAAPMRSYLWWVLLPVTMMVMVRHSTNSIGNNDLTQATTISIITPYRGIAVTDAQEARIRQYRADYDSLRLAFSDERLEVLALGQENHLMRAVTGCQAARYNEFWSNIYDSVYTAKYRPIIEAEQPIVFCSFSPQFKTKPEYKDRQSAMERMLRELNYTEIERNTFHYTIYIPSKGKE